MAQNENFLAVDFGATSIKLCEMSLDENNEMTMNTFAYREYEDELTDETREGVIEGVLRQMILECGAHARRAMISVSGQSALLRFGKVTAKSGKTRAIKQLALFEAKRNIPFPLNEVTLDYQLIAGSTEDQENQSIDVMSVVIKNSVVNQFLQAAKNVGLEPILVDLAPISCYNAARYNGIGEDGCSLIVSIGGRSTNLMFIEGERFYARTIPIAGHSITQQLAKEFGIGLPEAEEMKRKHGSVALADDGENQDKSSTATNVSRIIRNVFTRLYGEISRSINIYRAQQHGNPPVRIYLTGGSSTMDHCLDFFSEKFNLPIEYFNPMRGINISATLNKQRLAEVGHTFGETIGLAVRYLQSCPIEINLLPMNIRYRQMLKAKRFYLIIAVACLVGILAMIYSAVAFSASEARKRAQLYAQHWQQYEPSFQDISKTIKEADQAIEKVRNIHSFLAERAILPMVMEEIYRAKPRKVWIDAVIPIFGEIKAIENQSLLNDKNSGSEQNMMPDMVPDMVPGMGDPMEMEVKDTSGILAGYTIIAHTIADYDTGLTGTAELPATEPQYPFTLPEVKEEPKPENDKKSAKGAGESQDQSGENLFLRNLQKSRLFSSDPKMTVLTKRTNNKYISNGSDFEIRVKIDFEIKSHHWNFPVNNGESGNMMRGNRR